MVITQSIRRGQRMLRQALSGEIESRWLSYGGWALAGWVLSSAAVEGRFQGLALGLICGMEGRKAKCWVGLGAVLGYPFFWGRPGILASGWMVLGLLAALGPGQWGIARRQRGLMPALAGLIVSALGVVWLFWVEGEASIRGHLIQVMGAVASTWVFQAWYREKCPWLTGVVKALGVLALAQIRPSRYLGLGYVAAGYLTAGGNLYETLLAGLALHGSGITQVDMTLALSLGGCLAQALPGKSWVTVLAGALGYLPGAWLSGMWDVRPLPGLILGGALAGLLPKPERWERTQTPTGTTGAILVGLEGMALALRQMERLLGETRGLPLEQKALLEQAIGAACDHCPEWEHCRGREQVRSLSEEILSQPGLEEQELPRGCQNPQRLLGELRRGQRLLRRMTGERRRLDLYRQVYLAQVGYLASFLEGFWENLQTPEEATKLRFRPEIGLSSRSRDEINGDKCLWFPGKKGRFYVLVCDGMGTGAGAAAESAAGAGLLKQMLQSGFPPESALRCLNGLQLLRDFAGGTTVDLVQLELDTGKAAVYKWGAAPSYLVTAGQLRKIGTAGPPPGMGVSARETVQRLSLGKGEQLILLSDGVSETGLLHGARTTPTQPPGEMAAAILEKEPSGGDDATVVVIRLAPDV